MERRRLGRQAASGIYPLQCRKTEGSNQKEQNCSKANDCSYKTYVYSHDIDKMLLMAPKMKKHKQIDKLKLTISKFTL